MNPDRAAAWVRQYTQDNPEPGVADRLVMHMDFQCAVHALPEPDLSHVVDALRALKAGGLDTADGMHIQLTEKYSAAVHVESGRVFLLALELRQTGRN